MPTTLPSLSDHPRASRAIAACGGLWNTACKVESSQRGECELLAWGISEGGGEDSHGICRRGEHSQIHLQNEFECDGEKECEGVQGTSKTRAGLLKWKIERSESNIGRWT